MAGLNAGSAYSYILKGNGLNDGSAYSYIFEGQRLKRRIGLLLRF